MSLPSEPRKSNGPIFACFFPYFPLFAPEIRSFVGFSALNRAPTMAGVGEKRVSPSCPCYLEVREGERARWMRRVVGTTEHEFLRSWGDYNRIDCLLDTLVACCDSILHWLNYPFWAIICENWRRRSKIFLLYLQTWSLAMFIVLLLWIIPFSSKMYRNSRPKFVSRWSLAFALSYLIQIQDFLCDLVETRSPLFSTPQLFFWFSRFSVMLLTLSSIRVCLMDPAWKGTVPVGKDWGWWGLGFGGPKLDVIVGENRTVLYPDGPSTFSFTKV